MGIMKAYKYLLNEKYKMLENIDVLSKTSWGVEK
ncbi:hypothetical protein ABOONEI_157 [Aciduliprofundum boonei T469]|nr:hypothetical protein ABOONEI_157 [Aciduliprofundum boonei T469]